MVVRLVGQHMRRPAVPVGLPSFVFPFDAAEANFGGGFADMLKLADSGLSWVPEGHG